MCILMFWRVCALAGGNYRKIINYLFKKCLSYKGMIAINLTCLKLQKIAFIPKLVNFFLVLLRWLKFACILVGSLLISVVS